MGCSIGEDPNELVETDTLDDIPAVSDPLHHYPCSTILKLTSIVFNNRDRSRKSYELRIRRDSIPVSTTRTTTFAGV